MKTNIEAEDLAYYLGVVVRNTPNTQQSVLWAMRAAVLEMRKEGLIRGVGPRSDTTGLTLLAALRDGITGENQPTR